MKLEVLKNIIKESVREVIREELEGIQEVHRPSRVQERKEEISLQRDISKKPSLQTTGTGDVLSEMLNLTRDSMTSEDYRSIINADSSMVSNYSPSSFQSQPSGPEPGIDISKLDFVQNASKILARSNEKDRERNGI